MPNNPLAEVFGFPTDNFTEQAKRHRRYKLCPYYNKVPNCTKDKASNPLGVCSIYHKGRAVITCPVRFRQDWLIAEHAASYFFGEETNWTSLTEVRLKDANGRSAGNIDMVLVAYDDRGKILDFGSVEVQAVYISGNVREPFERYISAPEEWENIDWSKLGTYYPHPDYLSSSRKRLIPQLLYKGTILREWNKKQMIVVQKSFFDTLPKLPQVERSESEIAWILYTLERQENNLKLILDNVIYTKYWEAINQIVTPKSGQVESFIEVLQQKLDAQLDNPPDNQTILDIPLQ